MDWPRQPKSSYLWDQVPASTMLPLRSYLGRRRSLSRSFSLSLHLPLCHSFLLSLSPSRLPLFLVPPCFSFFVLFYVLLLHVRLSLFLSSALSYFPPSWYTLSRSFFSPSPPLSLSLFLLLFLPLPLRLPLFLCPPLILLPLIPTLFQRPFSRSFRPYPRIALLSELPVAQCTEPDWPYVYIRRPRHGSAAAAATASISLLLPSRRNRVPPQRDGETVATFPLGYSSFRRGVVFLFCGFAGLLNIKKDGRRMRIVVRWVFPDPGHRKSQFGDKRGFFAGSSKVLTLIFIPFEELDSIFSCRIIINACGEYFYSFILHWHNFAKHRS